MSLASEQERLVMYIDQQVTQILENDGNATEILISLSNHLHEIKKLMDASSTDEMDRYCQQFEGFYLFMTLLEDIASGIANGRISVPTYH